jgi:pseudomonalisin/xanthomonalisin
MHLIRSTLALALTSALATLAHAGTTWVSTETHAPAVYSHLTGEPLAMAEAVAPGQALHIVVSLKLRNPDLLDDRIASLRAGTSHDLLTAAQAEALHLPTVAQAQAVVAHLTQAGFRNITVSDNRLLVSAEGSVAMAAAAFHTELHNFGAGEERRFANISDAQVPAALKDTVLAVHGLHNAISAHPMLQAADATPLATTTGHAPTDFPIIYNASGLAPASNATLGIISEGNMAQTLLDFKTFLTNSGYAPFTPTVTIVGTPGTDTSGTPEWDLDSQDAFAAAGGQLKGMIFYTATSLADAPLTQAYNQAVSENKVTVLNISLGECETSAKTSGILASNDQIFSLGVAQGMTFSVSSGDSGSLECGKRKGNKQSYPAVSPYVMALGGTTLSTNGTAWAGETVWSGGGGGPSTTEKAKSWQTSSGVMGTAKTRGVPDISLDADPNSGSKIVLNGKIAQYGGTSLAAPLFAGFWARIQSAHGSTLTFPDPAFYKFGVANPGLFHDVTSGNNGGYTAGAGWDYATGFGSINVGNLATFINGSTGW